MKSYHEVSAVQHYHVIQQNILRYLFYWHIQQITWMIFFLKKKWPVLLVKWIRSWWAVGNNVWVLLKSHITLELTPSAILFLFFFLLKLDLDLSATVGMYQCILMLQRDWWVSVDCRWLQMGQCAYLPNLNYPLSGDVHPACWLVDTTSCWEVDRRQDTFKWH